MEPRLRQSTLKLIKSYRFGTTPPYILYTYHIDPHIYYVYDMLTGLAPQPHVHYIYLSYRPPHILYIHIL